jgi:hypothetical protein
MDIVDAPLLEDSVTCVSMLGTNSGDNKREFEYGSKNDQERLCHWLKSLMLPVEVADSLVKLGVRNIDDVTAMAELCPEVFDRFALLDGKKLWKAVAVLRDVNK